jgi:hypothetical protein
MADNNLCTILSKSYGKMQRKSNAYAWIVQFFLLLEVNRFLYPRHVSFMSRVPFYSRIKILYYVSLL